MQLGELYYLGIGDDASITKLAHYARVPDAVVMQHAIGNVAMRSIYRYIVHIGLAMFDANYFISRIFLEEPFMDRDILVEDFSFTSQTKANFLCEDTRRYPLNPHIWS